MFPTNWDEVYCFRITEVGIGLIATSSPTWDNAALHTLFEERIRTEEDATSCASEQALEAAIPTLKNEFRTVFALNCPTFAPTPAPPPETPVVEIVSSVIGGLTLLGGVYGFCTGKIPRLINEISDRLKKSGNSTAISNDDTNA